MTAPKINQFIKFWNTLTAPRAENPDIARQEYMTRVISIITFIIALIFNGIFLCGWLLGFLPLDSFIITLAIMLIMAISICLTYRGHWRPAGYLPPIIIYLTAVYGSYVGGPGAPAMIIYVLATIITSILLGLRAQWIMFALCVASYAGIGTAHIMGLIPQLRFPETAFPNRVIIVTATFMGITALLWFLVSQYRAAIGRARSMTRELEEIASELSETNLNLETEIAERRRAEDALKESEERYRLLFESSREAIVIIEPPPSFKYIAVNRAALEMFKIDPDKDTTPFAGPWELAPELQPDGETSRDKAITMIQKAVTDGWCFFEFRHRRSNGEEFPSTVLLSKFVMRGKTFIQASMRDVTERKIAEEQIKDSLREKEVLLKEIHHRVKNNFQIIISLLNLQSGGITDENLRRLFNDSVNRIRAMALVHEELYQSESISDIDFAAYLRTILEELYAGYAVGPNRPELIIECEEIYLGIDQAIPCGLILNELVTNSLKYAFTENVSGPHIKVTLRRSGEDTIVLTISDNGIGLPQEVDPAATATLGLQLVSVLIKQIHGTCAIGRRDGTSWEITFPARLPSATA